MSADVAAGIEGDKPGHSGFDSRIEQPRLQFSKYVVKLLQRRHDTIDAGVTRIGDHTDQRSPGSAVRKQRPDGTTTELTLGHHCQTIHVDDSVRVLAVTVGQHVSWERMRDW